MENIRVVNEPSPILKANFFSKIFFCWIGELLEKGYKNTLLGEDLYELVQDEETKYLTDQLEKEWEKELLKIPKKKKPSLLKAIIRIWYMRLLANFILVLLEETIRIVLPLVIAELLDYFRGEIGIDAALYYGAIISAGIFIVGIIHHPSFGNHIMWGMKLRVACTGIVYRETFKIKSNSLINDGGLLVSLLSTDAARLDLIFVHLPYFIIAPLQSGFVIYVLIDKVEFSFITGVLILMMFVPIQSISGKIYAIIKAKQTFVTDQRIDLIAEVINAIKIVKMYCWEEPYQKIIRKIRRKELMYQSYVNLFPTVNCLLEYDFCCLVTYISVAVFVNFTNVKLKASYIVLAMSFYTRLCCNLGFFLSRAIITTIGGLISIQRYQDFLMKPKFSPTNKQINESPSLNISNVSLKTQEEDSDYFLKNVSINIKSGELVTITGSVGSGKSLFLQAILNETTHVEGSVKVNGSIFYVSQEPWLFPSSVKENICFGKTFEKEKFEEVIKSCFLVHDLKQLSHAENTLIGDRGVNLSGGQKARICLARALYSDADIYLLDDPLSAVDANVAKYLFDGCINGYLKTKIRIFVTHHEHHLKLADQILIFESGKVLSKGSYNDIDKSTIDLDSVLASSIDHDAEKIDISDNDRNNNVYEAVNGSFKPQQNNKLFSSNSAIQMNSSKFLLRKNSQLEDYQESRFRGSINWNVYLNYFLSGGGFVGGLMLIILFIVTQTFIVLSDYYVASWASYEEDFSPQVFNFSNYSNSLIANDMLALRSTKFKNYTYLILIAMFLVMLRSTVYFVFQIRSSSSYHKKILNSIVSTNLRFFDLNPLGRIITRFSKDMGVIDEQIPQILFQFLQTSMLVSGIICLGISINYWIAVAIIPLVFIGIYVRKYFLATLNELKRLEAIYRSPIFIQVNNSLNGLLTIRACNNLEKFYSDFDYHMNNYTKVCTSAISIQRWFQTRLDLSASFFASATIFISILGKNYFESTSGQMGLLLSYILNLVAVFQWFLVQNCELSSLMCSVERIKEYSSLEKEPTQNKNKYPNSDWPQKGEIIFSDVSFSYSQNLPMVLKNISFKINFGEKIGIVGRTGAGKSSLIQAIFRFTEPSGNILIDRVNTKDMSLKFLRKKLSIIPQEAILFSGTIRSNIDPFNQFSDVELWLALEKVQLKKTVKEMKGGLEADVQIGGSNLSMGQKQLICLARAVVKKTKILIIDEATANLDSLTDSMVQKAIRECFYDCTVITIAHRIETIIDNDRIMCLDNGVIESFGNPYDLLTQGFNILDQLVNSLPKYEVAKLTEMARLSKVRLDECRNFRESDEEGTSENQSFLKKK